jgi:hypothetical protein
MGLPKGRTNNMQGKPSVALNKLSRDMRVTITEFLQDSWPEVRKEFHKLSGKDKWMFYEKLLSYATPKLQAQAIELDFGFE